MKATKEQFACLSSMFDSLLENRGFSHDMLASPADLWRMWTICMQQVGCQQLPDESMRAVEYQERPSGFGTHSEWLFAGLKDSHIETMFKKYAPQCYGK